MAKSDTLDAKPATCTGTKKSSLFLRLATALCAHVQHMHHIYCEPDLIFNTEALLILQEHTHSHTAYYNTPFHRSTHLHAHRNALKSTAFLTLLNTAIVDNYSHMTYCTQTCKFLQRVVHLIDGSTHLHSQCLQRYTRAATCSAVCCVCISSKPCLLVLVAALLGESLAQQKSYLLRK